jgi:hypothetical protein
MVISKNTIGFSLLDFAHSGVEIVSLESTIGGSINI